MRDILLDLKFLHEHIERSFLPCSRKLVRAFDHENKSWSEEQDKKIKAEKFSPQGWKNEKKIFLDRTTSL